LAQKPLLVKIMNRQLQQHRKLYI